MTILGSETNRKLRDIGASCLVDAIEAQDDDLCMGMTFAERMQMAVDEAHSMFVDGKVVFVNSKTDISLRMFSTLR